MHLATHLRNAQHSVRIGKTWPDRVHRFLWPYKQKSWSRHLSTGDRTFSFRYPAPVNDVHAVIRDNNSSDATVFCEVFDHGIYAFDFPHIPETMLDLGANIGFAAIYLARRYPTAQIACVEPIDANLRLLRNHLTINGVCADVFPAAVAVEDGPVQMQLAPQDCGHKVAAIPFGYPAAGQVIAVDGVSVPSLMNRLGWSRIGLAKIDIEGYEGILLAERAGWLERVDALAIECHPGYGEPELRTLATQYGFLPPVAFRGIWVLHRG